MAGPIGMLIQPGISGKAIVDEYTGNDMEAHERLTDKECQTLTK